jgi:hypothetical protein
MFGFKQGNGLNLNKDNQLIDYVKIIIKDMNPYILEANSLLDFYDKINISTGEIKTTNRHGKLVTPFKNAYYNGLEFKIYDNGTITLSGSLHKYWNNGAHNYDDFDFNAFTDVLKDLQNKFNIALKDCILKCLEVGINIIPPIPTNRFLNNCFLHKTKPFEDKLNSDGAKYKQVQHSQYIIKIYNKALQYKSKGFDIQTEILRFEIKYIKMQKLNERGIYNLKDLFEYGLQNFKVEVLTEFNNILFYDNTIQFKSKQLVHYKNPLYWIDLLERGTISNFQYHRKQLKKITSKSSQKIQFQTAEIMTKKIDFLNSNTMQIDPLIILSKPIVQLNQIISKNTLCKVTGINISMQKDNSILLSHTGLKYYYETDRKIFEQVKRKYLSKQWNGANFETQIKEIAHNIRNTKSNQTIKQKKIYQPQQTNLLFNYGL